MIRMCVLSSFAVLIGLLPSAFGQEFRRLPVREYRDKMKGGWIGQIIGVSWGAPTEFRYRQIMPEAEMPPFRETLANDAFGQDDLYVEMTFLRSLEQYGLEISQRQAGIDFANSGYPLWVANKAGRNNLRNGIAPPDSSHPQFHNCAGAIDYQIESDYAGLIAPGMPNLVIALGEKFGRLMNYGDGMYAGQFMGAMYAEAFFETDIDKIIAAGLAAIPAECRYAEMVRDMLGWRRENPADWEACWAKVDKKYRGKEYYVSALDVKLEGAFVLMGLLYGNSDPDRTIIIACRCGSDSDCNPSSAGGVLGAALGAAKLPERYYRRLDQMRVFSHTAYNFPTLLTVCEKLARQAVTREGGRIETDAAGDEVFVIPVKKPIPSKFEDLLKPGPIANSRFTEAERAQITAPSADSLLKDAVERFAPGWRIANCGPDMEPGLRAEELGKKNVLVTHPLDAQTGCVLRKSVTIPAGATTKLRLVVGRHPRGDWDLIVRANDQQLLRRSIDKTTAPDGWSEVVVDLGPLAGQTVGLELVNQPTGWAWEAAYWAEIQLVGP